VKSGNICGQKVGNYDLQGSWLELKSNEIEAILKDIKLGWSERNCALEHLMSPIEYANFDNDEIASV
jgi:hypothetical protein